MALDTANKRSSAVNTASPWRGRLPFPDGIVDSTDRLHIGLAYAGIAATAPNKRSSAIHVSLPWRSLLPFPDGTVGNADRAYVAYMYDGILAESPFASGNMVTEINASANAVLLASATMAVAAALSASNVKAASGTIEVVASLAASGQLNEEEEGTINVVAGLAASGTTLAGESVSQIPTQITLDAIAVNLASATMAVVTSVTARGTSVAAATAEVTVTLVGVGQSEALIFGSMSAAVLLIAAAQNLASGTSTVVASMTASSVIRASATMSVVMGLTGAAQINEEIFPHGVVSVEVGFRANGVSVSVPGERVAVPAARTIDWKTLTDQANKGLPTVPDYEFGYGRRRRVFRQRKS